MKEHLVSKEGQLEENIHVYSSMSKKLNLLKVLEICTVTIWGEGVSPCDLSLTPKNIYFSQLIICCWLELEMSSVDVTESKLGLS